MNSLSSSLLLVSLVAAYGEVRSVTIGVDVNSPYGISEPWVMIREGLLRLDDIESVSPQADRKTATGELRTKNGRVPDVDALAKGLREIGAGATLRGVEATIDGRLEKRDGQFLFRLTKTDEVLLLQPATQRIQLQPRRKSPEPLTETEQKAFQNLSAKWQGAPLDVRITGPITKRSGKTVLAVRHFDFQADTARETIK
jgi:hypothetical protein